MTNVEEKIAHNISRCGLGHFQTGAKPKTKKIL